MQDISNEVSFKFPRLHRDSNTFLSRSEGHQPISLGSGDKVLENKAGQSAGRRALQPRRRTVCAPVSLLIPLHPPPCSCTSLPE